MTSRVFYQHIKIGIDLFYKYCVPEKIEMLMRMMIQEWIINGLGFSFASSHLSHQGIVKVKSIAGNFPEKKVNSLFLVLKSLTEMNKNLHLFIGFDLNICSLFPPH